jgi:hypothetical protein
MYSGRSTPKRKRGELNYMYATVGIERNDSSDDEFIPEDADDAEDDDQATDDSELSPNLGKATYACLSWKWRVTYVVCRYDQVIKER